MEKKDSFQPLFLPPADVCSGCRNYLTVICVEECAPEQRLRHFRAKKRNIYTVPDLPSEEEWRQIASSVKYAILKQQLEVIKRTLLKVVEQTGVAINE
jgi:hypothetical protein